MKRRAVASSNRDALWELAERGVWYRKVTEKVDIRRETYVYCGVVVNGVELDQPHGRGVRQADSGGVQAGGGEESEHPPPDPAEELLKEWPELQAFGVDWVRKRLGLRERLIEIAKHCVDTRG